MKHLDLFSGIGGFAIAAESVWPDVEHTFCEIDPFCQAILKKHWPNSYIHDDIRTLTNASSQRARMEESDTSRQERKDTNTPQSTLVRQGNWTGNAKGFATGIDLLTGGFPCQPFSGAGKRKGTSDDRHLWPEMRRVIQEFSPRYVVAENVRGLLSIDGGLVFESVCTDLEALGYEVQPVVIPACAVGAPHRRDRVWIVANSTSVRRHSNHAEGEGVQRKNSTRREVRAGDKQAWRDDWPQVAARLCRVDDGLPSGVPRSRGWRNAALKAYGNAIVPQVAEQILRSIQLCSSSSQTGVISMG
jgi:DNA (cytosine-5)-methyltransferase 1